MNKAQRDIRRKKRVLEHRMYGAAGSSSGAPSFGSSWEAEHARWQCARFCG